MARKSNQQKNSADRQTSSHKKGSVDLGSAERDVKGRGEVSKAKVFPGEELPDGNHPSSPQAKSSAKTSLPGDENKGKQKPKKQAKKDKKDTNGISTELPDSSRSDLGDSNANGNGNDIGRSSVEENGPVPHSEKVRRRNRNHRHSRLPFSLNRFNIQNVLESLEHSDNAFIRSLKTLALSTIKTANEWLEKHQPLFITVMTKIQNARVYAKAKIDLVYPVVLKWLMNVGSIIFLIAMLWLDCAVRGIDSFLRMGTTSFFSVIWCSVFSSVAMVGIFKFLVVLILAAIVGLFIGFTLGILVLALSGAVFLWLYGSFWATTVVIILGGLAFGLSHERIALLITTLYSVYCAWTYVGWLGLGFAFNLAFVSSDILIYFLKNSVNQQRRTNSSAEHTPDMQGQPSFFNSEHMHASSSSETGHGFSSDRSPGTPSTSGADSELTSEDEIVRLLNCTDLYSALGLTRYESVDVSLLKREYKKKAMLVHPDKNMGNEKAVEAFKKLQNAYEVLLDSAKQKVYDDELRKEELLNIFRRFQSTSQKNEGHGFFASGSGRSDTNDGDPLGDSRRIACKKCNNFHLWLLTRKSKSQARWCQDCKEFHPAKDGDGWVEQSSQPFFFGLLQKIDTPAAFVCADSKIYDASEWYICQGMRCPANTHKPSFHVNTSIASKQNSGKGANPGQRGGRMPNVEEGITEEDLYEWFHSAMQAGVFDNMNGGGPSNESPSSNFAKNKRKKKGKKQW